MWSSRTIGILRQDIRGFGGCLGIRSRGWTDVAAGSRNRPLIRSKRCLAPRGPKVVPFWASRRLSSKNALLIDVGGLDSLGTSPLPCCSLVVDVAFPRDVTPHSTTPWLCRVSLADDTGRRYYCRNAPSLECGLNPSSLLSLDDDLVQTRFRDSHKVARCAREWCCSAMCRWVSRP